MNFPVLPVGYQHSVSGNIRTNTFSFSAEKLSTGYGASQYPTNTWAFRLPTIDLYRIIHGD